MPTGSRKAQPGPQAAFAGSADFAAWAASKAQAAGAGARPGRPRAGGQDFVGDRGAEAANEGPPLEAFAPAPDTLDLALHEHGVGFFLPPQGVLHSTMFTLPCGALIEGEFVGDLSCEAGSIIVGASARVYGSLTADRLYIEGTVGSRRGQRSVLTGRALIAASAISRINADLRSRSWSMHTGARVWGSMQTIEDGMLAGGQA